jgi:undecaprenyl-diphosphatase
VSILQAIILGITQGATEFAPISSSGHLIVVPWLFGWHNAVFDSAALNKTFDVALHMGTLVGAVIYFRKDLWRYIKAWFASVAHRSITTQDQRFAWALVIGTIPGAALGALFEEPIQNVLGQPWLIAVMLAVFGIVLWAVDLKMRSDRGFDTIGPRTGLFLGVAQGLALQPGVSRSGITMTAARLLGIDRESAARASFLLAIPIIAGAGLFKGASLVQDGMNGYGSVFFWGFVSSAISGFIVIWGLLKYLRSHSFAIFMWYRIGVAVLMFALMATGVRAATI